MGAAVGSTVTVQIIAFDVSNLAFLLVAAGLFSFKLLLVLGWLPLMGLLERITRTVSPAAEGLKLAEQLAYEVPRQVARIHRRPGAREIIPLHKRCTVSGMEIDEASRQRLRTLTEAVRHEFRRALHAVGAEDHELARSVIDKKTEVRARAGRDRISNRVRPNAAERLRPRAGRVDAPDPQPDP